MRAPFASATPFGLRWAASSRTSWEMGSARSPVSSESFCKTPVASRRAIKSPMAPMMPSPTVPRTQELTLRVAGSWLPSTTLPEDLAPSAAGCGPLLWDGIRRSFGIAFFRASPNAWDALQTGPADSKGNHGANGAPHGWIVSRAQFMGIDAKEHGNPTNDEPDADKSQNDCSELPHGNRPYMIERSLEEVA